MSFRRLSLGVLFAIVLVATGYGVSAIANKLSTREVFLGTFAGYRSFGTPRSISVEWHVPRIVGGLGTFASTWIGLQASSEAFVQVGITENDPLDGPPIYSGFWSSDSVGFHPQPLSAITLSPGDLVDASITPAVGGWKVSFHDRQRGVNFTQTIDMPTQGFDEAEWFQEDPSIAQGQAPYPRLSSLEFQNLTLDGRTLHLGFGDTEWMSVPGRDFAPTPIRDGSFSIVPVQLNAAQSEFAGAATPVNLAARVFANEEGTWRANPPSRVVAIAEARTYLSALRSFDQTLLKRSWSSVSADEIHELIRADIKAGDAYLALADAEPHPSEDILNDLISVVHAHRLVVQRINASLGLP